MHAADAGVLFRTEADLRRADARQLKATRMKSVGDPISLGTSKVLQMAVHDHHVWTAESNGTAVQRDLRTGQQIQRLRASDKGPVSALLVCDIASVRVVVTGSWDMCIRIFDAANGRLLTCFRAHDDFVKALAFVPSLNILVSGGSDNRILIWDVSALSTDSGLVDCIGSVKHHTRPVVCLAAGQIDSNPCLYSGDSMGVIIVWRLETTSGDLGRRVNVVQAGEFGGHVTGVTDFQVTADHLWTASADNTVLAHAIRHKCHPACNTTSIVHPAPVKSLLFLCEDLVENEYLVTGSSDEVLRVWELSRTQGAGKSHKLRREVDVHSHEITAIQFWLRQNDDGNCEPWIVSGSLDGTLRRWRLSDLIAPGLPTAFDPPEEATTSFTLTEDEERELMELV